jgi:hypothetical protein
MEKGQFGYINWQKKINIIKGLIYFIAVIIVYFIGTYFVSVFKNYFYVVSAMLILPSGLFLSRYLLYTHFSSGDTALYESLLTLTTKESIVSDLILVRGKKTIPFDHIIFTQEKMICLVNTKRKKTDKIESNGKSILDELLKSKGLQYKIKVVVDADEYLKEIKQNNGRFTVDATKVEPIKQMLVENSI